HAHPVGAGIVLLALANCLLHVYLTAELRHTTTLLLLLVGAGSLFVSSAWFALVVGGTLVGWTVIVWRLVALVPALAISGEVMRFAAGLASATVIGGAIHVLRVRTLRELERLSIKNALHARTLEEVAELLAVGARRKKIELGCFVSPALPAVVAGDPGRLRQVLSNLVGNAVKFTEQGEVVLRVEAAGERGPYVLACFEIADTGIGIPSEVLGRLFQPFAQADASTKRHYGGTGLGLVISEQLV